MLHYDAVDAKLLALLRKLLSIPELESTRLVGGTALALQMGHRKSVDIDLFGIIENPENLVESLSGFRHIEILKQSKTINVFLIEGIKVDIVNYPYPWLEGVLRKDGLRLAGIKDITAMKLGAITGRGTRKDFIDIFFLLQEFRLDEMLDLFLGKYREGTLFLVLKSLTYFSDAENDFQPEMISGQYDWDTMKAYITDKVEKYNKLHG